MADNGWSFLNNAGKSSNYYGADGSWGYRDADGSGSYYGTDGSWGFFDKDGTGSYYGADGSFAYTDSTSSNSSYSDGGGCSCASIEDSASGLGILAGLALGGVAIWIISKLFK
jgi:hypothetical protein